MPRAIRIIFTIVFVGVTAGCGSQEAATTPAPIATVQFFGDQVELGGTQWMESQAIEGGVRLELEGIYALDKDVAFLFGGLGVPAGTIRSVMLRTNDGGKHWAEVMNPVPASVVRQATFVDGGQGWAMVPWTVEGPGPVLVFHSKDYGQTWEKVSSVPKWQWYGYAIRMQFFSGRNGQIDMIYDIGLPSTNRVAFLTTSDGGVTWQETGGIPLGNSREAMATAEASYRSELSDTYKSIGQDGSYWAIEPSRWDWQTRQITVSQQNRAASGWSVVSVIPKDLEYVDGKVALP